MARKKAAPAPAWAADPQYLAFEADLTAHPDDDTPRLVLADWLEEHGDEHAAARAEFIRVQVELDKLGKGDPRRGGLERRQEVLLTTHEEHWLGPLKGIVTKAVWRRGFPQRMKLGVRAFMDNADELFRQAPIVELQLLRISQTKMTMQELAACPHFARLRGLSLPESSIGDEKLGALLGGADLGNLETLDLPGADVGGATLKAIASGRLPRLRHLNLNGNSLEYTAQRLFREGVALGLKTLDLGNTNLNQQDIAALFGWPGLATVEKLTLRNNRLGNEGGRQLAACPHLENLRSLDLFGGTVGMRGMLAIADSWALAKVEDLDLGYNNIGVTGLEGLLRSAFIGNLRELRLNNNGLADAGMRLLAEWPGLSRVTELELSSNEVLAGGVEELCWSPHLGRLTGLGLSHNPIGGEGGHALANCSRLSGLRRLNLSMTGLDEPTVEALLASPYLKNLEHLGVELNLLPQAVLRRVYDRFRHGDRGPWDHYD